LSRAGSRTSSPREILGTAVSDDLTDLIVIGGGVTGCAVARDAALRGLEVTLIEQGDLGSGTSGRFHAMLQSGARYVTTDSAYAAQCMRERRILERTASHARIDTGGLFVALAQDPPEFVEQFADACRAAEIPCRVLSPTAVAAREVALAPVVCGFEVPDAVFLPWQLVTALAEDAHAHGANIRTRHRVTRIEAEGQRCDVELRDAAGRAARLAGRALVIAAGPWSGALAAMAGQLAPLELAKGSLLIIGARLFTSVVNRCRPPGSFDIMVPFGDVTLFGTTSQDVADPGATGVDAGEEADLLAAAREMTGALDGGSGLRLRAYAGVRPLAAPAPGADGAVSRRHMVTADDQRSLFTVAGGSFTTHRAMAEDVVDRICSRLRASAPCETASTPLPAPRGLFPWSSEAALKPDLFADGGKESG
jgi:glycerol-3-phosphate dehydrogenase